MTSGFVYTRSDGVESAACSRSGGDRIPKRDDGRRRVTASDQPGDVRSAENADQVVPVSLQDLGSDFGHAKQGPDLNALGQGEHRRGWTDCWGRLAEHRSEVLRGHHHQDGLAKGDRIGEAVGGRQGGSDLDVGQELLVAVLLVDVGGHLGLACPQDDDGRSGAPASTPWWCPTLQHR